MDLHEDSLNIRGSWSMAGTKAEVERETIGLKVLGEGWHIEDRENGDVALVVKVGVPNSPENQMYRVIVFNDYDPRKGLRALIELPEFKQ